MGKLNKQYLAEMARKGWITVSAAAKLCRRHRATVYYWIKRGHCVHTRRWGITWIARDVEKATTRGPQRRADECC